MVRIPLDRLPMLAANRQRKVLFHRHDDQRLVEEYGISGRGNLAPTALHEGSINVVLKLSWPVSVRCNEATTIEVAREVFNEDHNALGCLLLDWENLDT